MDKLSIGPKEEISNIVTISPINMLIWVCLLCIVCIVYIIVNIYTLDGIKDNILEWTKCVIQNSHISNGTFYINQFQI